MKFVATLLVFLCALYASAVTPAVDTARKASVQIAQQIISGDSFCSATAIGPHALLTATHCELPSDALFVRAYVGVAKVGIAGRIRDDFDHTILLLTGPALPAFVDVELVDELAQAEEVFTWGNPGKFQDIFTKGYIAGYEGEANAVVLFSFNTFSGASGSGIFNNAGHLVAVVSLQRSVSETGAAPYALTGAFRLAFKQADIDKARAYQP